MTVPVRNLLFVLAGTLAGFLSGLMNPLVFGARGAMVGYLLSAAVVFLQPRRQKPGTPPPAWAAMGLAIAAAALATGLIAAWHLFLPDEGRNIDFQMAPLSVPARFATILCYTVPLLLFYRERQLGRSRAWAWFFAAPVLGALVRAWGYHQMGTIPFNLAIGALPFVLLWLLAAAIADPAWTPSRWERCSNPPPSN